VPRTSPAGQRVFLLEGDKLCSEEEANDVG